MRVQTPILMDHDYTGQLRYRLGAGVGADRPHEISLDASVALRGGHSLVSGLDPVIGAGNLLAQSIIRHQCFDNRGGRQTACKSLHALHKGAATNLTVNEIVVELYGFDGQFGFYPFHWLTPAAIIPSATGRIDRRRRPAWSGVLNCATAQQEIKCDIPL